jgi:outer membrane biosynthesis protein TonB
LVLSDAHVLLYRRLGNGLDERAMAAASRLKFSPATQGGKPIRYWTRLVFEFYLR